MPKDTVKPMVVQVVDRGRNGYEDWNTFAIRDPKTNHCLAIVGEVDRGTSDNNEANAYLFAAAEVMQQALTVAREHLRQYQEFAHQIPISSAYQGQEAMNLIDSALRKASIKSIETWSVKKSFYAKKESFAAMQLDNGLVAFVNADKNMSGITKDVYGGGDDYSLHKHVMTQIDYGKYTLGLTAHSGLNCRDAKALEDRLLLSIINMQSKKTVQTEKTVPPKKINFSPKGMSM
jgi:hypothetical protein